MKHVKFTLNSFRKMHTAEVLMARAAMPKTAEADTTAVPFFAEVEALAAGNTQKTARTLTATLAQRQAVR